MGTSFKSKCLINKKDKDKMETAGILWGITKNRASIKLCFFVKYNYIGELLRGCNKDAKREECWLD